MKKSRTKEQRNGEFSHRPFRALGGFTPERAAPPPEPPRSVPPAESEQDEADLFLGAVRGARKLSGRSLSSAGTAPETARKPAEAQEDEDRTLFLQAMKSIGTATFRDETQQQEDDGPRRSASNRMRQLRRGTIKISSELDLHGFIKEDALGRLEGFLFSAAAGGRQAVLVITGKGINSPEGPVLQRAVAEWLRTKGRGIVVEFHPAPRDRGGSGAFVVFLRSRK